VQALILSPPIAGAMAGAVGAILSGRAAFPGWCDAASGAVWPGLCRAATSWIGAGLIGGTVIGIPLMATLGLTLLRRLRRLGRTRWLTYVLTGGFYGTMPGIVLVWTGDFAGRSTMMALPILTGAFSGGIAWLFLRPDRDPNKPAS